MQIFLKKQVHSTFAACSSNDVWLQRVIDMPFVPHKGMTLKFPDFWAEEVDEVAWDTVLERVVCYVGADRELYEESLNKTMDGKPDVFGKFNKQRLGEIVSQYTDTGWEKY